MPNHDAEHKTPDELQEEIEHTRAELDSTLDEIGRRLSPREIKERTVSYVKDTASTVGDAIQRNPVPVAVAGTAVAAVLLARQRSSARSAREREEQVRAVWERLVDALESRPSGFAAGDTMGRLSNFAVDARDQLADLLGEALAKAQHRGGEALQQARHAGREALQQARVSGNEALQHARRLGEEARLVGNGASDEVRHAAEAVEHAGRTAGQHAHELGRAASDVADRIVDDLTVQSRAHPYLTLAIAVASGALLLGALRR